MLQETVPAVMLWAGIPQILAKSDKLLALGIPISNGRQLGINDERDVHQTLPTQIAKVYETNRFFP